MGSCKAHPNDGAGKELIKEVAAVCNRPEFRKRVIFLENYELSLARVLVQGVDVWLNNPLREHEATGRVFPGNLANLFIVSGVTLVDSDGALGVRVERARGAKCERCWTYSENVGRLPAHPAVCERCAAVLEGLGR